MGWNVLHGGVVQDPSPAWLNMTERMSAECWHSHQGKLHQILNIGVSIFLECIFTEICVTKGKLYFVTKLSLKRKAQGLVLAQQITHVWFYLYIKFG